MDVAVLQLADAGSSERGQLVQAVVGMYDPGAFAAQFAQDRCELVGEFRCEDSEELMSGASRVGQRSEEIEDRRDAQRTAGRPDKPHRRMMASRECEADVRL